MEKEWLSLENKEKIEGDEAIGKNRRTSGNVR